MKTEKIKVHYATGYQVVSPSECGLWTTGGGDGYSIWEGVPESVAYYLATTGQPHQIKR